jgi:putative nucleotidyltransferase with HDIG domain
MKSISTQASALIDVSKLPSLPQTLIELIDKCNSNDRNLREIGAIVARDATISARVLQLSNSAFIGARNKFTDIEQAAIYLGIDTIRNLAISVSVHETFSDLDRIKALDITAFWHHSFLTAVLAKTLGQEIHYPDPAEAYLTGLLHDIGKLLLYTSFPDRYLAILEEEYNGDRLPVLEQGTLRVTHPEAGSLLISQWNLDDSISDAVYSHHDDQNRMEEGDRLAQLLYTANRFSNALISGQNAPAEVGEVLLGIDPEHLPPLIREVKQEVDQITSQLGINTTAAPLVRRRPSKKAKTDRLHLSRKVQAISTIGGVVDNLMKADNLNRVVRIIEESFHILFNIPCCLLILPDADSKIMRIHVSTNNQHHGHDELSIPVTIGLNSMLHECMRNGTIQQTTAEDSLAADTIEAHCLRLLDAAGLVAVPVPLEDAAMGVLVAGVGEAESTAILEQQETLSLLAAQVGMRLRLERLKQKAADEQVTALTRITRQIAHEINNPVATLQNCLVSLGMKLEDRQELHDDLQLISSEIRHIAEITHQLNDLSSTNGREKHETVNINTIVEQAAEFYRQALLPENKITIRLNLDKNIPAIKTSAIGLRQITGNLIKNSIEALNGSGELTIVTNISDPTNEQNCSILISVEDNGPGTPEELADNIFTAGVTTKGVGHVGLGLAISRKLVHELGGTISYSSGKNVGTRFTISLPYSVASAAEVR